MMNGSFWFTYPPTIVRIKKPYIASFQLKYNLKHVFIAAQ